MMKVEKDAFYSSNKVRMINDYSSFLLFLFRKSNGLLTYHPDDLGEAAISPYVFPGARSLTRDNICLDYSAGTITKSNDFTLFCTAKEVTEYGEPSRTGVW